VVAAIRTGCAGGDWRVQPSARAANSRVEIGLFMGVSCAIVAETRGKVLLLRASAVPRFLEQDR
jgi:hypothetical protein